MHKTIARAQVHYFQHETTKAYICLAKFLDTSIVTGSLTCGGCYQHNRTGNMKQCSGCKTTCYCSGRCQNFDWKTDISARGITHKILCPLMSHWRKKSKKEKSKDENGEEEYYGRLENGEEIDDSCHEEQIYERLTELCLYKFKQFFESLLQRGQEQARAKEQKFWQKLKPESESEVNSL